MPDVLTDVTIAPGGISELLVKFNDKTEESTPDKLIELFPGFDAVPLNENVPLGLVYLTPCI